MLKKLDHVAYRKQPLLTSIKKTYFLTWLSLLSIFVKCTLVCSYFLRSRPFLRVLPSYCYSANLLSIFKYYMLTHTIFCSKISLLDIKYIQKLKDKHMLFHTIHPPYLLVMTFDRKHKKTPPSHQLTRRVITVYIILSFPSMLGKGYVIDWLPDTTLFQKLCGHVITGLTNYYFIKIIICLIIVILLLQPKRNVTPFQ